jgi:aldose sugar dehydrogenase
MVRSLANKIVGLSLLMILVLAFPPINCYVSYADPSSTIKSPAHPFINDPNLKAEVVITGLGYPTAIAFLGSDDILVLDKINGTVQRIVNGKLLSKPLLDVNVANKGERGMLGIAIAPKHENKPTYVFLYYTESATKDGDDSTEGKIPLGKRLYRYELVDNKLVNPKLLLDLPVSSATFHNGGKIVIGPDKNVYLAVGEGGTNPQRPHKDKDILQGLDGRSGILRVTQDGKSVGNGILGNKYPLNLYYAYGIRNSFGMDFDPLTKMLWDTENGPFYGDEINLVNPGFNSGWAKVQGIWEAKTLVPGKDFLPGNITLKPQGLIDFGGRGKYSQPEFTWYYVIAPTALKFLNSDKLGKKYENDMFVGNWRDKLIYHFELNKNRTDLSLNGPLADRIAKSPQELQQVIFAQGFDRILDIEVGPDGYLYVVTKGNQGMIYRILPTNK